MRTFGKLAFIALIVLTATILMMSCGKKGSLLPNQSPTVQITSYNGDSIGVNVDPDTLAPADTVLFQQKIYWFGTDPDGWVVGYAYRVLDNDLAPLPTPGNLQIDADGWVYHYKPGADETIPLTGHAESPNVRTIWTDAPYAIINFPAADSSGVSINVPSVFELKCIDDRSAESEIARRFFIAESVTPQATVTSTKGDPADKVTGTGIRFEFAMIDEDPYVVSEAWKYKYKLAKLDADGNVIPGTETDWYWLEDFGRRARVLLSAETDPALSTDYVEGSDDPVSKTQITVVVYDQAGIASEPETKEFWVKEGYSPGTLIYDYNIYVLGANHFVTYQDVSLNITIPTQMTADGIIFSTPFFIDKDARQVALWSSDIRIFMSWGYHGEFAGDNPRDRRYDNVMDEETNVNYLSEIQYFDLRLNGAPFDYPPYQGIPEYYHMDDDGVTEWLRVPINSDIAQEVVINNIAATDPRDPEDYHVFEVRAVDLQNVGDVTPARYEFKLDEPESPDQKNGILIIDDESVAAFAPEPEVQEFYADVTDKYNARVDYLNRQTLQDEVWDSNLHYGWDVLSPTDLQTYKVIIWHSDNPSASEKHNFYKEYDVFNLYLRHGGNVIVTGGANLFDSFNGFKNNAFPLLYDYFGISTSTLNATSSFGFIPGSVIEKPWFTHTVAQEPGYEDIHLNFGGLTDQLGNLIGTRGGMGAIGYFDPQYFRTGVRRLYRTGLKLPGTDDYSPTQEQYDLHNNQICAVSYQRPVIEYPGMTQINSLWSFPPCYMLATDTLAVVQPTEMQAAFELLIDEIMAQ
ncbi:MAG: hypothetical protein K8R90_04245 [Candidatus Cloacimonetes bacterium]|nr:hypothetical protein [Candidatus Cloacimonadota bacterium]